MVRMKNRSWIIMREAKAGRAKASAISARAAMPAMVEARVRVAMRRMGSVLRPGKQPARAQDQHDEKGDMPRKDLPFGVDLRAQRLRHPDDRAPRQRAPERAQPADDHRLKRVDQPGRTD